MSMNPVYRTAALAAALAVLMGCERPASGEAVGAPPVASAAPDLQHFLSAHGEDIEACFSAMPELETQADHPDLRDASALPATAEAGHVVVAIDASGSMAAPAGDVTKMEAAKQAASGFLSSLPDEVSVGLLAFGHRGSNRQADKAASCAAAEPVYAVGEFDQPRVAASLDGFDATGWTPLAAAIEVAGGMLPADAATGPQAVYVVSDGEDTCGGDPVAAARALHESGALPVINVIGFDLPAADRAQLEAVAEAGGGVFTEVEADNAQDLAKELRRSNHDFVERLQAGNANFGRQLRNSNRTARTTRELGNCIAGRSVRERNALSRWSREHGLPADEADSLQEALRARHQQFEHRAATIVEGATRAKDEANAGIEGVQEANKRE